MTEFLELTGTIERNVSFQCFNVECQVFKPLISYFQSTLMDDEEFEDLEEVEDDEDVHGSKRKRSLPSDRIPIPKSMKRCDERAGECYIFDLTLNLTFFRSLPTSLTVTMTKEASHISPNKKRQKPEERGRGSQRSHPNVIVRKLMESDAKDEDWKSAYKVQTTDGELRTSTRIR